ncbi:VWA domain-containing protein [Deltaproteobacteria bacterium]|nr:VWA domain-containing protein [Deltaproteobacteria bacterium]
MNDPRLERWRLVLGEPTQTALGVTLAGDELAMDRALGAVYDHDRKGGLGASNPNIARWLGDIRGFFPSSVVRIIQTDAIERLNLKQLLLEPELLEGCEPDVALVATLLSLSKVLPVKTREMARRVVRRVVDDVERRLRDALVSAVRGALNRSRRTRRPRANAIDWDRTIRKNLRHYQPDRRTIIAETLVGYQPRSAALRDIVLCVDQSGSMASSLVYASIAGAVLASIRSLRTRMIVFDTAVVDLTEHLDDPVDLLFGTQLGGGTDIHKALGYCAGVIDRPRDTTLVLVTDLYEGGDVQGMIRRAAALVASGVNLIVLLALSDDGAPSFDANNARRFAEIGVPCFACTPDKLAAMLAASLQRQDIGLWAASAGLVVRGESA